jgi:hypothetical protein
LAARLAAVIGAGGLPLPAAGVRYAEKKSLSSEATGIDVLQKVKPRAVRGLVQRAYRNQVGGWKRQHGNISWMKSVL